MPVAGLMVLSKNVKTPVSPEGSPLGAADNRNRSVAARRRTSPSADAGIENATDAGEIRRMSTRGVSFARTRLPNPTRMLPVRPPIGARTVVYSS